MRSEITNVHGNCQKRVTLKFFYLVHLHYALVHLNEKVGHQCKRLVWIPGCVQHVQKLPTIFMVHTNNSSN